MKQWYACARLGLGFVAFAVIAISTCEFSPMARAADSAKPISDQDPDGWLRACLEGQRLLDHSHTKVRVKTAFALRPWEAAQGHHQTGAEFRVIRDAERFDLKGEMIYETSRYPIRVVARDAGLLEYAPVIHTVSWYQSHWADECAKWLCVPSAGLVLDGYGLMCGRHRWADLALKGKHKRVLRREKIADTQCAVVVSESFYGDFSIWVSELPGHPPLRIVCDKSLNQVFTSEDNEKVLSGDALPDGSHCMHWRGVLDDIKTEQVAGSHVPKSARLQTTMRIANSQGADSQKEFVDTYEINREIVESGGHAKAPDAFDLGAPAGTHVADQDHPESGIRYDWNGAAVTLVTGGVPSVPEMAFVRNPGRGPLLTVIVVIGLVISLGAIGYLNYAKLKRSSTNEL
jgi:hypothetical protein